ncbi:MAG: hypothetical protein B193_0015 [Solidesulfovibrio magneticus str. Maddingley MBC34]|uniref:Uncharacterized protein n=1 Tax=Solidesulfovibrio magneticus str. Maddingley MBC34 TaxID=1206767 RepID=K6GJG2_9BACT|nr:MAG: hypothetical protein B193_0015 [Solidesulfovibrio magneticus str. Maddingley MBC34]
MDSLYRVYDYSNAKLFELLANASNVPVDPEKLRGHASYFYSYFNSPDISAKTIVVENQYVDKDYLLDFAEYYLTCFKDYKKTCSRLHFFSSSISSLDFDIALQGKKDNFQELLQESYLGFIVLKPLPKTVIGRTCLRVYSDDAGRRNYLGIRKNNVSLFGFKLSIESLPFQEQDTAVAACATSALWSVFHATGEIFHHSIPSPSLITKTAVNSAPTDTRHIPNGDYGLNPNEMASVIRSVGLEPLKIAVRNEYVFRGALYAYLKCGIPVVLGVKLVDVSDPTAPSEIGRHAVAVTGYSIPTASSLPSPSSGLGVAIRSLCIDKIYVHDDQIGPFSKMILDTVPTTIGSENVFSLSTTWPSKDGTFNKVKAIPEIILVPLYHKIRIPFIKIFLTIYKLAMFLETVRLNSGSCVDRLEWDIFLTTTNEFKFNLIRNKSLKGTDLQRSLLMPLPKYIWCVSVFSGSSQVVDLLFDATELEQGDLLASAIVHDSDFVDLMRLATTSPSFPSDAKFIADKFKSH